MTFSGLIIGLTGGIGSGKTAASDWFAAQQIHIVDADVVAREIVEPGQPALTEIRQHFGDWAVLDSGTLDRAALREHIFKYPEARHQLEAITHPRIREAIIRQLSEAQSPYAILVSPLLFETNQHELTHDTILIDVPVDIQLERACARDHQQREQIQRIINAQMPREQKQQLAGIVIDNAKDLTYLHQQLEACHQDLLARAKAYQRQG